MVIYGLPIILAIILSIVHYFSEKISPKIERYHHKIRSVSAGIFITLIFLDLIPELISLDYIRTKTIFFFILIGFIIFHAAEKYLYQHTKQKKKLLKELAELHFLGFFADHFILGFLLVLVSTSITFGVLIFIPLALHTIASSISLEHIHEKTKYSKRAKIILSSSTTIGAIIAFYLITTQTIYLSLLSLFTGMVLYISTRDMLPKEKEGNLLYFFIGLIIMVFLLLISGKPF